jgi:glucose-1-phosphate thymidylyltransferase
MVSKAVLFAPADRPESGERSVHVLRPPTSRLALLPVGNRPLVLHALEELTAAGIDDIAVVSEEEIAEEVQETVDAWAAPATTVTHLSVDSSCSFVCALKEAGPTLDGEPFVVHLCDSLRHDGFAKDLASYVTGEHDVLALVEAVAPEVTPVGAGLASVRTAGIYVFGPGVLELPDQAEASSRWDLQIAAAAEQLAAAGGRVQIRLVSDSWRYRQRPDVLLQANRFFLSGLRAGPTEAWLENTDLQGPVVIDPTARLRSTTVRGPVVIGPDVEISDAYIGPYSSIGRGVVIENAEVEHSIILPGASIRHLGGRLEASIVGADARIFRDFRLPRALRLNVGEGAEVALT